MALEIGNEENAEPYVRKLLGEGGRVMGFGHRVYKAVDPRANHLVHPTRKMPGFSIRTSFCTPSMV